MTTNTRPLYERVMLMGGDSVLALMQEHGIKVELSPAAFDGYESDEPVDYYSAFPARQGGYWAQGYTIKEAVAVCCQKNGLSLYAGLAKPDWALCRLAGEE